MLMCRQSKRTALLKYILIGVTFITNAVWFEPFGGVCYGYEISASPVIRPIPAEVANLQSPEILLDGTWQIAWPVPKGFQDGQTNAGWKEYKVPGQWLQQGFDIPKEQAAVVVREFKIPDNWHNYRVFLRFDSMHANSHYWLNGKELGTSQRLYTPVEFEITDVVRAGQKNFLALEMKLDSVSETLSHTSTYAHHNLCGIDRSVRIFALPELLISSLHIDTNLDDKYRDAELQLKLILDNTKARLTKDTLVRLTLLDPKGKETLISKSNFQLKQLITKKSEAVLKTKIKNPLKWSAEKPHLYSLKIELLQDRKVLEAIERSVGFRCIKVQDGKLLVNGKSVKLAGINRHEFDPLTGRADTVGHAKKDAELFKAANINYIRTSHYPPTREFLDACDETGLYVQVEAPFCWTHTQRAMELDPNFLGYFMNPTAAMLEYHRNHPSVILWSLSNESGYSPNEKETELPANYIGTLEHCRKSDPARPVCFNNAWAKDGRRCDIAILHYQPPPLYERASFKAG